MFFKIAEFLIVILCLIVTILAVLAGIAVHPLYFVLAVACLALFLVSLQMLLDDL